MISHMEAQGLRTADLRTQASQVLSSLTEDQLLVVLAYARALAGEPPTIPPLPDDLLEGLQEDRH